MKPDERELLLTFAAQPPTGVRMSFLETSRYLGMHRKRAKYICDKWDKKGWYDWVHWDGWGWLTPKGRAKAKELEKSLDAASRGD